MQVVSYIVLSWYIAPILQKYINAERRSPITTVRGYLLLLPVLSTPAENSPCTLQLPTSYAVTLSLHST